MSLTKIGSIGINTGIQFAGVTTVSTLHVGSGVTLSSDGDGFFTGVITATSYSGIDLSDVTGATGDFSIADKIVHTGDTDTAIRFPSADTVTVETGGVTRATVSGNNIDFPDAGTLRFGASNDLQIYHGTGGASNIIHSNTSEPLIINASGAGTIRFDTDSTERARIDSSGRLLIGTTTEGAGDADDLTIATSSNTGLTLRSGTSGYASVCFSDGTSGVDEYRGYIQYGHSDNMLMFGTDGVERVRIKSDGKFGINTNSPAEMLHVNGTTQSTDYKYTSHPGHSAFTGDNSTTGFTIQSGHSVNSILVVYNGVVLTPTTDYTVSGTTLTTTFTPLTNAELVVRYLIK